MDFLAPHARHDDPERNEIAMSEPNSDCPCKKAAVAAKTPADARSTSRRNLLLKIGTGLNGLAAALVGVPILGYALSSLTRPSKNSWISLGPLGKFPEGTPGPGTVSKHWTETLTISI